MPGLALPPCNRPQAGRFLACQLLEAAADQRRRARRLAQLRERGGDGLAGLSWVIAEMASAAASPCGGCWAVPTLAMAGTLRPAAPRAGALSFSSATMRCASF